MICPSCGHDNIEGADRCEECMTSLFTVGARQAARGSLERSVMEDDIRQLEQEFLGVSPDTSTLEVIRKMKAAGLGCAQDLDGGERGGIFTARDLLYKLTGNGANSPGTARTKILNRDRGHPH